ncbi:DUF3025 domain-containing protein [Paraglaciecola marina]|uniref:DUF3025 domain-containing protein n=1 Tax=Paraglaciecola marina TaxID=2500157 RepID=UPI00105C64E8|nr:DUF3025 domain-containing protein [Paraglaciecola marina]
MFWLDDFIKQLPMLPLQQLEDNFELTQFSDWPNAAGLNLLKKYIPDPLTDIPEFVCQSELVATDKYYEQIIYEQGVIPTRPSGWHDLFNGLIWLQFPKTKRLLNELHIVDINQYGVSPRTLRRNNLTHFDECGVVITYQASAANRELIAALKSHQWQQVFVENRQKWGLELNSFMFGHANLEMLLNPFIGLTGKWLAVEVDEEFQSLPYQSQLLAVDTKLNSLIKEQHIFCEKKPLSPLPLLGIPEVWDANLAPSFYENTDYFRPKPQSSSINAQAPQITI